MPPLRRCGVPRLLTDPTGAPPGRSTGPNKQRRSPETGKPEAEQMFLPTGSPRQRLPTEGIAAGFVTLRRYVRPASPKVSAAAIAARLSEQRWSLWTAGLWSTLPFIESGKSVLRYLSITRCDRWPRTPFLLRHAELWSTPPLEGASLALRTRGERAQTRQKVKLRCSARSLFECMRWLRSDRAVPGGLDPHGNRPWFCAASSSKHPPGSPEPHGGRIDGCVPTVTKSQRVSGRHGLSDPEDT